MSNCIICEEKAKDSKICEGCISDSDYCNLFSQLDLQTMECIVDSDDEE